MTAADQITAHLLAALADVPFDRMLTGKITDDEYGWLIAAVQNVQPLPLYIGTRTGAILKPTDEEMKRMPEEQAGLLDRCVDIAENRGPLMPEQKLSAAPVAQTNAYTD